MGFNRYGLELIGLWPKNIRTTEERLMCNLRTLLTFLTILFIIMIPALHSLTKNREDIMIIIDNLQYTLPVSTCLLRIAIFWWKKDGVTPLVSMMANDWMKSRIPQEKIIMITKAQIARIIIIIGYSIMLAALFVVVIMPIYGTSIRYITNVTDPRILPLQTYYIYDINKTPQYELTFFLQAVAIILCLVSYTGVDHFLSLAVFHISGQLEILQNRLINLDKTADFQRALKRCVMDHIRLLRAIVLLENTFNVMLLLLFLYFGTLFAFYGFYIISVVENGNHKSISFMAFFFTIVANTFGHMCLYCAMGEILTAQCDRIHHAVYSNEWYTLVPKNARNVVLLMAQTNKPLHLTAGKIFPLTMATFCDLIKTSGGYISVLLAKN